MLQPHLGLAVYGEAGPFFTAKRSLQFWGRNGLKGRVENESDPLAHAVAAGATLSPANFYAATDKQTAIGLWVVADASAATAGRYRAQFRKEREKWVVTRLDVVDGLTEIGLVTPFCHQPGDMERFADLRAKWEAKQAQARETTRP